jgi:TatD DNase family protein
MIDSHCHLADAAFADDADAVIARARAGGVERALCILSAGDAREAARAAELVGAWPDLRLAVGVHPHQAKEYAGRESEVAGVVRSGVAAMPAARAVGEIGLDYHYAFSPRGVQREVFRVQLRVARELGLPVVVHTREAEDDTLEILRAEGGDPLRGVLHCFSGSRTLADQAVELGLHLSFAGIVTFPRADEVRAVAGLVPADRLLVETDSPYLAPVPYRGRRNEPAWVVQVLHAVAAHRGVAPDRLGEQVTRNFAALFGP